MDYIVISYFTKHTGYEAEVENLIASLRAFQLPMDIVGIRSQGSWDANTHYKPYFIQQMLAKHFPKDVLYLDADARVEQHPRLFDQIDFDVAAYWNPMELIGSTLYFANNPKTARLLRMWNKLCMRYPEEWDQVLLERALHAAEKFDLRLRQLPPNYAQIFDLMAAAGEPVISQHQASRRFKAVVDAEG